MALINCPECGRENVSDSAVSCPNCGYGIREHFEKIEQSRQQEELLGKETQINLWNDRILEAQKKNLSLIHI